MKKIFLLASIFIILSSLSVPLSAKRPLNHDDFDSWERVSVNKISDSGNWTAFSVIPQEGDGVMTIRNNRNRKLIKIPRAYNLNFSADEKWALALIKPFFSDTRKAKIDEKKDYEMPQDSLAIIDLSTGKIEKIANVLNYKIGEKGGDFFAYTSCDTLFIKPEHLKNKESGRPLLIRDLKSTSSKTVKWVKDYEFSKDGRHIALRLKKDKKDSVATDGVALINLPDTSMLLFDRDKSHYTLPVFNDNGSAVAYTASEDTIESGSQHFSLFYIPVEDATRGAAPRDLTVEFSSRLPLNLAIPHSSDPDEQTILEKERAEAIKASMGNRLIINQFSRPAFSKNGRFLIVGVAREIAPDDTTIVKFETPSLDIWRWDAPMTPPQEKANLKKIREKTLPVVFDLQNDFSRQLLTTSSLAEIEPSFNWDSEWALIHDPSEEIISRQWNYLAPESLTVVNVADGRRISAGKAAQEFSSFSPDGKFIVIFKDRNFYAFDVSTGETRMISNEVPYPVWDEKVDYPIPPQPIGIAGWGLDDNRVLVYDMFDIWALDMKREKTPVNLTSGFGRMNNLILRYHPLDKERKAISPGELMVLDILDAESKARGLATVNYILPKNSSKSSTEKYGSGELPKVRLLDKYKIGQLTKAKNSDTFVWQRANFETVPDLWSVSGLDFSKGIQLTKSNTQMKDILWGTARLIEWYAYDGKKARGVLYLPEDFDPEAGSYPLLSVFYETNSDELYTHYTMEPSWSWVNYPFYVSRGYAVFVPDIHYSAGLPGECAYNYVCSGVEEILKRYPSIDPKRVGIDGQSWGGYQTAYLITRTNMFACAGSGAPVANMSSAFGGIRWGSGDSRQAQYEMGQSRIGRNLWEAPELYIANSPVFHADRVNTPLLIMHNDEDGAVPWYQGIELFMALRRLQKPVWMLQYNGESHNLKERRNRKDITRRLQQFFDHYLKGGEMPRWMKEGISPLRKGQDFGY